MPRPSSGYMAGQVFGRWTLISKGKKGKHSVWECLCTCGAKKNVYECHLKSGASRGCKPCALVTHGMSHTGTMASFDAMHARCYREKHPKFHLYGGSGIFVCDRWHKFENFFEDMGAKPDGMTIERIDSKIGYMPGNCKWATYQEQNNNRSINRIVEYQGEFFTAAALARHLGMTYAALTSRLKYGKSLDDPYKKRKPKK